MQSLRLIIAALRTAVYGSVAGYLAISEAGARDLIDGMIAGGALADYLTWLIKSILFLPTQVLVGCYELCINVLFAWFMLRYVLPGTNMNEQSLAAAFLAFMLVLGIKTASYSVAFLEDG